MELEASKTSDSLPNPGSKIESPSFEFGIEGCDAGRPDF